MHPASDFFTSLFHDFNDTERNLSYIALALLAGIGCRFLLFSLLRLFLRHLNMKLINQLIGRLKGVSLILLPAFFILLIMPLIQADEGLKVFLQRTLQITFIVSFSWILVALINFMEDVLLDRLDISKPDNYSERKRRTQILFVKRLLIVVIFIVTVALVLMRFDGMRKLGVSILTSAGILGIIIGIAAQKSIANLLAGMQIAFTQPIRLDDVVIVEGEWGWIEEITLTYVVVRIWDLRRLILPITYFLEKPFQNWTRNTADIMGTVYLYTDYSVPIEELRTELKKIVSETPLWDKKVCQIVVTNLTAANMELRALVSAANSGNAWDLRCLVREKLILFIRNNYPESLARNRVEISNHQAPPGVMEKEGSVLDTSLHHKVV